VAAPDGGAEGGGAKGGGADRVAEFSPCCRWLCAEPAKVTGMLLLLLSVLVWVCQAELLQSIHDPGWSKPYFQAASLKSVWALTLPIWYVLSTLFSMWSDEITFRRPLKPTCRVVLFSLGLTLLVQTSSATWIASLNLTAVSINSAIYNVNPLLVYVFSIPLLKEACSYAKTSAVLLAVFGTMVVTYGSTHAPLDTDMSSVMGQARRLVASAVPEGSESAVLGSVLVLASATLFALKEVLFKRHFASVSVSLTPFTDALLVVGLIGACSLITLAPLTALLHVTGIETFVMPTTAALRGYGMVAVLMALYQACLLAAIALTSPTFVAMGTMLNVPLAIAFDYTFKGYIVPAISLVGIVILLAALAIMVFAGSFDSCCCRAGSATAPAESGAPNASSASTDGVAAGKRELV